MSYWRSYASFKDHKVGSMKANHQDILKIAKGSAMNFVVAPTSKALRYGLFILLSNYLGAASFGLFFLGLTVANLLSNSSILGLMQGVVRYMALFRGENDNQRTKGVILSALFITVCSSRSLRETSNWREFRRHT